METSVLYFSFVILAITVIELEGRATEPANGQGYSTKYDNFDVKKILTSDRLLKRYVDCLMDRLPCPSEGKFLKDILPDAIGTRCSKCNAAQKKQAAYIMQDLLLNHRAMFFDLCKKYDPTGEARKEYEIEEDE